MKSPIVFLIFNRPEKTAIVFEAIRQAKPPKLFIIADGPRQDRPGEAELCKQTRSVVEKVDWDCQVFKNYSNINLGCRKRIGETGLPWVFDRVEEAIILEDDCLPHLTFFRFCQELLEKYRYDERVMAISGTNPLIQWKASRQSYYFSYHFNCWGWASWRRVWNLYDVNISRWSNPETQSRIKDLLINQKEFLQAKREFDGIYYENLNSWAYQMVFLCYSQTGAVIGPSRNLIQNIGFDSTATNTSSTGDIRARVKVYPAEFPLKQPQTTDVDLEFERRRYFRLYDRSWPAKISRKLRNIIAV